MEVGKGIIHHKSKEDYELARKGGGSSKTTDKEVVKKDVPKKAKDVSAKEEISDKAKKIVGESGKKVVGNVIGSVAKGVISAVSSVGKIAPTPPVIAPKIEVNESKKVAVQPQSSKIGTEDPAIIFISGYKLKGISGDEKSGVSQMAENFKGATHFEWDQEDSIIKKILKHGPDVPLVLVGHSYGGDDAVSIANRLNSVEYGFRSVDLLVTLDSVGMDNDIIPENVKKNLNFIGDQDLIFNDGPNIARDSKVTTVINELRSEDHTSIDDTPTVQSRIFSEVRSAINPNSSVPEVPQLDYLQLLAITKLAPHLLFSDKQQ